MNDVSTVIEKLRALRARETKAAVQVILDRALDLLVEAEEAAQAA